jgi:asparagine synthase (glutamine-hydrolysing)
MSAQVGVWNIDGRPIDSALLDQFSSAIAPYAPDGKRSYTNGPIGISYRPAYTTVESRLERQPYVFDQCRVITWDGRLDNGPDLINQLSEIPMPSRTDVEIVAAAFVRWGTACFQRLVGDWALSIWDPSQRTLLLAKDYIGIRHLFYHVTDERTIWCTHMAAIVTLTAAPLALNDEYIAGYLASYPRAHLTPYREIQSVPPGTFVTIRNGNPIVHRYWAFEPKRRIHYPTDTEYEEHFRYVFRQAVRRRLRSDSPILAELSGGLDSSSIVCMADDLIAQGEVQTPKLDTASYYDSHSLAADERPYFTKIEERRGRVGHHFDIHAFGDFFSLDFHGFSAAPGLSERTGGLRAAISDLVRREGYRVVLSGIGGDEFLGGVPDPRAQLADLIVLPRPILLIKQLMRWSLIKRRPWIQLLLDTLVRLLPLRLRAAFTPESKIAPWINTTFARRYRLGVRQLGAQGNHGFWLPSRQEHAQTFITMTRQFAYAPQHFWGFEEKRYPYLDQNLIEFVLAIPPTQLLRPGQRRSLMRRALEGVVPAEILSRRTKGGVSGTALAAFQTAWPELQELFSSPLSARMGYVDQTRFLDSLLAAKHGDREQLLYLLRTIYLELWLRGLEARGIIRLDLKSTLSMARGLAQQES